MDNVPENVNTNDTELTRGLLEVTATEGDILCVGNGGSNRVITWSDLHKRRESWRKREDPEKESNAVRKYYKKQEAVIESFQETDRYLDVSQQTKTSREEKEAELYRAVTRAAILSFTLNVLLAIAKLVAAILSGSLAIISSLVDSAVDLVSGLVIWYTTRAVRTSNIYSYPTGKTRLEPLAIVVISVVMALASVQMILVSVETLVSGAEKPDVGYVTIAIVCVFILGKDFLSMYLRLVSTHNLHVLEPYTYSFTTIITKAVLYLYCRRIPVSSSQTLAQDHRNDVLSNTLALGFGAIGAYVWPYADPIGAIAISVYIAFSWWKTGAEQIRMLTGHTASAEFLQMITWVCYNHHPKIDKIDTVRAFHIGINFLVEVHICLAENMSLKEAHNIGEPLQQKLEKLPSVECAFVHLDYDTDHHPNIEHKRV